MQAPAQKKCPSRSSNCYYWYLAKSEEFLGPYFVGAFFGNIFYDSSTPLRRATLRVFLGVGSFQRGARMVRFVGIGKIKYDSDNYLIFGIPRGILFFRFKNNYYLLWILLGLSS